MTATVQHEPTDACADDHCYAHNVDEPGPGYLICGECGHLYRTRRDLRRAVRRMRWELAENGPALGWGDMIRDIVRALAPIRADRVSFCPECSHDF